MCEKLVASQNEILKQYMELQKKPTLRSMASETGIQTTRLFRIMNGSPMKLSEFEILKKLIQKKMGLSRGLVELSNECLLKLSSESIREIEKMIKRKLAILKLKQTQNENSVEQTFA